MLLYIHRKFKGVHSIHETNLHLYSFVHKNTNLHKYMYYYVLLIKKSFQNCYISIQTIHIFAFIIFVKYIFSISIIAIPSKFISSRTHYHFINNLVQLNFFSQYCFKLETTRLNGRMLM